MGSRLSPSLWCGIEPGCLRQGQPLTLTLEPSVSVTGLPRVRGEASGWGPAGLLAGGLRGVCSLGGCAGVTVGLPFAGVTRCVHRAKEPPRGLPTGPGTEGRAVGGAGHLGRTPPATSAREGHGGCPGGVRARAFAGRLGARNPSSLRGRRARVLVRVLVRVRVPVRLCARVSACACALL